MNTTKSSKRVTGLRALVVAAGLLGAAYTAGGVAHAAGNAVPQSVVRPNNAQSLPQRVGVNPNAISAQPLSLVAQPASVAQQPM